MCSGTAACFVSVGPEQGLCGCSVCFAEVREVDLEWDGSRVDCECGDIGKVFLDELRIQRERVCVDFMGRHLVC